MRAIPVSGGLCRKCSIRLTGRLVKVLPCFYLVANTSLLDTIASRRSVTVRNHIVASSGAFRATMAEQHYTVEEPFSLLHEYCYSLGHIEGRRYDIHEHAASGGAVGPEGSGRAKLGGTALWAY